MKIYVNHEHKLLLGITPKCGSSYLRMWFLLLCGEDKQKLEDHFKKDQLPRLIRKYVITSTNMKNLTRYKDYYKISVIRNPYHRIVSGFLDIICFHRCIPKKITYQFDDFNSFINHLYSDFKSNKHNEIFSNIHFVHQSLNFENKINIPVNFWNRVIDMKNLIHEIQEVEKKIGVDINLNMIMNSQEDRAKKNGIIKSKKILSNQMWNVKIKDLIISELIKDYSKYYNNNIKDKVYELYKTDFENFKLVGYDYTATI